MKFEFDALISLIKFYFIAKLKYLRKFYHFLLLNNFYFLLNNNFRTVNYQKFIILYYFLKYIFSERTELKLYF